MDYSPFWMTLFFGGGDSNTEEDSKFLTAKKSDLNSSLYSTNRTSDKHHWTFESINIQNSHKSECFLWAVNLSHIFCWELSWGRKPLFRHMVCVSASVCSEDCATTFRNMLENSHTNWFYSHSFFLSCSKSHDTLWLLAFSHTLLLHFKYDCIDLIYKTTYTVTNLFRGKIWDGFYCTCKP